MTTKSDLLPNSFQTPNFVVDTLYEFLLPNEVIVLMFAVRHIYGWQDKAAKQQGNISLSMFEGGFVTESGAHFGGCPLGRSAIIAALRSLQKYGVLLKIGEPTEDGQEWTINFDHPDDIDWWGLEQRREERVNRNRQRTYKASVARTPVRRTNPRPSDEPPSVRRTAGGSSDDTSPRPSDELNQTHIQTHINPPLSDTPPAVASAPSTTPKVKPKAQPKTLDTLTPLQAVIARRAYTVKPGQGISKENMVRINRVVHELRERFINGSGVEPEELDAAYAWCIHKGDIVPKVDTKTGDMLQQYRDATGGQRRGPSPTPDPDCPQCGGMGFFTRDVPPGDPDFGQAIACDCLKVRPSHERV